MAWLEAITYLATLTYKFFRGDSEERRERRRREEYYDSYSTEWNSQDPYGSQQFDPVYGHGVEYYEQSGSEKRRHGKPQEEWCSYRIRDQSGDTEIDVVGRQRVEKKKRRGFTLCRRVDYEERGMITKKYVDWRGKEVVEQKPYSSRMYEEIEQKPYSSRMYEENQYLPVVGDDEEGIGRDADAGMAEMVYGEHRKRW
ncbi:uncharacterized protein [Elaeis guineensis]|uniref:uncharacterized protein n=1 Tax=Elaeis guineensis var. tenera TaxID=51953 RepID=UPI003C6CE07F